MTGRSDWCNMSAGALMADTEYKHRQNSVALSRLPKEEFEKHRGEFAILIDGKVCAFRKTNREALTEAMQKYAGHHFSVRRVEPQPVDVGFLDLANYNR